MKADIASWGVSPTFAFDGVAGRTLTTPSGPSPKSPGLDPDVDWLVYVDGSFLYLDSGSLDLGVVRDSVLNATNKFQSCFENFEALAKLGGHAYRVTSSLCASGDSQIATDIAVCSLQGS
jgi:hypothetical protein